MEGDSLIKFIEDIRQTWGPLSSEMVEKTQAMLERLVRAPISEPWLAALQGDFRESCELYRDPTHGFVLLVHLEREETYRHPHDHGDGWVIYAVQRGEMEMGTYACIEKENGEKIVRREKVRLKAGESRVYLPGDIHDTRCVSSSVLMFRLTSCDLKAEQQAIRVKRYAEEK